MIRNGLIAIAGALALSACASATAEQNADGRDCFYTRSIRGYEVVDESTVRVRINSQQRYQLTTVTPIENSLDYSSRIAIDAPGGFVCTGSGSGVEILGGRNGRSFFVNSVTRVPAEEVAPSGS